MCVYVSSEMKLTWEVFSRPIDGSGATACAHTLNLNSGCNLLQLMAANVVHSQLLLLLVVCQLPRNGVVVCMNIMQRC